MMIFSEVLGWIGKKIPEDATKKDVFESFREAYRFVTDEIELEIKAGKALELDAFNRNSFGIIIESGQIPKLDVLFADAEIDEINSHLEYLFGVRENYLHLIFYRWWKDRDFRAIMFDSIEMSDVNRSSDFLLKWWKQAREMGMSRSKLLEYTKKHWDLIVGILKRILIILKIC